MQRTIHLTGLGNVQIQNFTLINRHYALARIGGMVPSPHLQHLHSSRRDRNPSLAHRQPCLRAGAIASASAASASFTASAPSHAAHGDEEGPEGELHAVETAIRANALIFAAKLGVFFISNSR
jgi:hypothetical protein